MSFLFIETWRFPSFGSSSRCRGAMTGRKKESQSYAIQWSATFFKKRNKGEPQKIFLPSQLYNRIIFTRLVFHEKNKTWVYMRNTDWARRDRTRIEKEKKIINHFRLSKNSARHLLVWPFFSFLWHTLRFVSKVVWPLKVDFLRP